MHVLFLSHTHTCMHAHMHVCTHAHTHTYVHTCMYAHTHTHTPMCTHACMHTRTHTHLCAHMHAGTHTHAHTHTHTQLQDTMLVLWIQSRLQCTCTHMVCSSYDDVCACLQIVQVDLLQQLGVGRKESGTPQRVILERGGGCRHCSEPHFIRTLIKDMRAICSSSCALALGTKRNSRTLLLSHSH